MVAAYKIELKYPRHKFLCDLSLNIYRIVNIQYLQCDYLLKFDYFNGAIKVANDMR